MDKSNSLYYLILEQESEFEIEVLQTFPILKANADVKLVQNKECKRYRGKEGESTFFLLWNAVIGFLKV